MNKKSQETTSCIICGKPIVEMIDLCNSCTKNPHKIERARSFFATKQNLKSFKILYFNSYKEIKNINSQKFWDNKFDKDTSLSEQDPMTKDKIKAIAKSIPDSTKKILDLGFGMGYLEETIDRKSFQVYGIDLSNDAVKRAKKKFKGEFIQGDIEKIKSIYKSAQFDTITALELVEHISPSKIFKFFADVRYLLKTNGTFIISTPLNEHLENKKGNPSGHVREYTIPILKTELEISGFTVVKIKTFYAFGKYYFLKKLLAGVFPWIWEPNNMVIVARKI